MATIVQKFSKKLEEWGVDKNSLTRGTFIFGGVAGVYIIFLWSFCYFLSPTKYIVERLPWRIAKETFSNAQFKAAPSKYLKNIPDKTKGKLGVSFAEMLVLKTALGPIALPFKVWLTIKLTALTQ